MDTLIIELSAALIDNPATPDHRTKVEITLENPQNSIEVENKEGSPRSVHKFTLKDPQRFGYGSPQNLTIDEIGILLAISCSLANSRILFSPLQPFLLAHSINYEKIPTKTEVIEKPSESNITVTEAIRLIAHVSTVLGTKLKLDEKTILNIVNKLIAFRIFDTTNRNLLELNILEAVKRYGDALMAAQSLSCFSFLYSAFEKAINADEDRKDKDFDKAASGVLNVPEIQIEELRKFNNRIKHALRNNNDLTTLKAGESKLAELSKNLKNAADKSILSRI